MTATQTATNTTTTQVYRVYIRAGAPAIWDAITKPEWTDRYGYTGRAEYDLRPGGAYRVLPGEAFKAASAAQGFDCPEVIIDGEVIEADPPRRLVSTFRMLMDPDTALEGFTRVTHEIKDLGNGVCMLTLTHELDGAPRVANLVAGRLEDTGAGGGHAWILSDLKTLLETGTAFEK